MVHDSENQTKDEAVHLARLALAVREIEGSADLRYLFRHLLTYTNSLLPSSVFTADAHQTAYNLGVQDAGIEIARVITQASPSLWPALINEEITNA